MLMGVVRIWELVIEEIELTILISNVIVPPERYLLISSLYLNSRLLMIFLTTSLSVTLRLKSLILVTSLP